jgi:hypothetical protein
MAKTRLAGTKLGVTTSPLRSCQQTAWDEDDKNVAAAFRMHLWVEQYLGLGLCALLLQNLLAGVEDFQPSHHLNRSQHTNNAPLPSL